MRIWPLPALMFFCCCATGFTQEKSKIRFGKISPEDFKQTKYPLDTSANAVVIADIGSTEIVGNNKGTFSLAFRKFRRVHLLNKNGYSAANVEIPYYTSTNGEEEVASLKAYTYTLENGKIVETKLDVKEAVFKDKINKRWSVKKFTFPAIKEGSIIEYEYKLNSDFIFNLRAWEFQGEYPCLWSEYTVGMPEFYYYVTLTQGYQRFHIQDKKDRVENFSVNDNSSAGASDRFTFTAGVTDHRWVMKDVPAMKEESYTSTIRNHIARIEFQLAELRHPFTPKNVMGTWTQACEELLKDEDFGYALKRDNGWLSDVVKEASGNTASEIERARNIFTYVRDHMTCTNYNATHLQKSLKNVLRERNGTEAEINLLLTAMLLKAGFAADPVMLSTRAHGYAYAMYPLMDRFNYVVTRLLIGDKTYFLDASKPRMGFGKLGYDSYNGHARVINAEATPLEFVSDSLMEKKLTSVLLFNEDNGVMTGTLQSTPGYYESYNLRSRIQEKGKDNFFSEIAKAFNSDVQIKKSVIDSLTHFEEPLRIAFEFAMKPGQEDIIYINPMFSEGLKENPFKSAERKYPVEMPYAIDETYVLRLDIPSGYTIDELPKQVMVKLNEAGDGMFEYRLSESGGTISLRSRVRLTRAYYQPDEYEMLREFFNLVVKKHNEQIVFKKKK